MAVFPDVSFNHQIIDRGIKDLRVISAMKEIDRALFVSESQKPQAYEDAPLPIGSGQTISQPYMVAFMSEALGLHGNERVLEVGTGCGYQTAILAKLAKEIFTIELREELQKAARENLTKLKFKNVTFKIGDGHKGIPEEAPFAAIIVTAAPAEVPEALLSQLANGGKMIIPVGKEDQELLRITRRENEFTQESLLRVRFVPMVKTT